MSDEQWQVITGDCLEVLPTLAARSVDAVITDPPYGLGFMGKDWDHGVPGVAFWVEALRVAKPGATLLAFGGTRTFHRLTVAIEDAGWEIRDCIMWVYGSGFPKSHQFSKRMNGQGPAWQGYGTALKPAWEPIIVAMRPLNGTFAHNALEHDVAGLWIDGGRIPVNGDDTGRPQGTMPHPMDWGNKSNGNDAYVTETNPSGRWPANVIHDGSDEVLALFPVTTSRVGMRGNMARVDAGDSRHRNTKDGTNSLRGHADDGSAARFFYCAKASRSERNAGLEGFEAVHRVNGNKWTDQDYRVTRGERPPSAESGPRRNVHPTVKPTALMRYLARITRTPTGGVVLDPFAGSGTTGIGAVMEGRRFIGIELDPGYADIARARIAKAAEQARQEQLSL